MIATQRRLLIDSGALALSKSHSYYVYMVLSDTYGSAPAKNKDTCGNKQPPSATYPLLLAFTWFGHGFAMFIVRVRGRTYAQKRA